MTQGWYDSSDIIRTMKFVEVAGKMHHCKPHKMSLRMLFTKIPVGTSVDAARIRNFIAFSDAFVAGFTKEDLLHALSTVPIRVGLPSIAL